MITATLPLHSPAKFLHPPPTATTALPRQSLSPPAAKFHTSPDFEPLKALLIRQANMGHINQALATIELMAQHHLTPDLTTYSVLLKSCIRSRDLRLGQLVHSKLTESETPLDSVVLNSLITLYSKCNDWVTAKSIFEDMGEKKDLVSWSAMISCFAHNGMEIQSVATFADMLRFGECPNQFCFAAVIQACCRPDYSRTGMVIFGIVVKTGFTFSTVVSASAELGLLTFGQQLHNWVVKSSLCLDVAVGCSLLDMYAKCASDGSVKDARKVFDRLSDRNVMSWTAIITGYVQSGGLDKEAVELYCRMIEDLVSPNHFTFSSLLKACGNLSNCKVGEQVYNHAVKLGMASDSCVGNSLISMYARCGSIEDARKAFEILFEKNLVSYNTIVDCYAKNLDSDKAFELINQIGDTGIEVDAFTFASLLSGAASVGAVGP
ncbi:hypothetical protein RJ639_016952 [Escallonia herrerae]|uniref:Pentatricopeptide repeat-containing protein n=1 Tax=Escallonia herrerae TaxID=1293975 RepID=A0AA88VG70_9ASTE|nr:hypothetical protein RJ639_016952 [Escallonia herrerae]